MIHVSAAIFAALALVTVVGAWRSYRRLKRLEDAWEYRETLAEVAGRVEKDEKVPCNVRAFISGLADRAFDDNFIRFYRIVSDTVPAPQRNHLSGVLKAMRQQYEPKYVGDIITATTAFSYIVIYSRRPIDRIAHMSPSDAISRKCMWDPKMRPIWGRLFDPAEQLWRAS